MLNHPSLTHESFLMATTPQDHPMDSVFPRNEANIPSPQAELWSSTTHCLSREALHEPLGSHSLETFPTGQFVLQRKLEEIQAWVPGRHLGTKHRADTSVCFPPICVQRLAGGGGHCEPTHVPVSGSWSCCSHPRWLNALFNSFLNIPRSAVIWRRIRCVTTGKLEKILSSVSLPPLDLSPCSDYCPPAVLIKAHKKHRE